MRTYIRKRKYANGGTMNDGTQLGMVGTGLTTAGSMTGNPYLAGAGLVASGISSVMAAKAQKEAEEKMAEEERKQQAVMESKANSNILANYPTKGIYGSELYAYGGKLPMKYADGGLLPTSNDTSLVVGDTHNQDTDGDGQTGVQLQGGEVEKGEIVDSEGRVFSKRLGYADRALGIINSPIYKKFESIKTKNMAILNDKKVKEVDKNTANRNLSKITNPLDGLFTEQEAKTASMGVNKRKFAYGGELDYYKTLLPNTYNALDTRTTEEKVAFNPNDVAAPDPLNELGDYDNNQVIKPEYSVVKPRGYYGNGNQNISTTGLPSEPKVDTTNTGNFDTSSILNAGRFIDNAVNANLANKVPVIPKPKYIDNRGLNTKYDISANLNDINSDYSAFSKNIDRSTTDISQATSNKQAAYVNLLKTKGKLYQDKTNIENDLKNKDIMFRTNIESQNNNLTNQYNKDVVQRDWDKIQMTSANAANLADDFQNMSIEKQQATNDKESLKMYAVALNKTGVIDRNLLDSLASMIESGEITSVKDLKTKTSK